jgi:hypothetical protein
MGKLQYEWRNAFIPVDWQIAISIGRVRDVWHTDDKKYE